MTVHFGRQVNDEKFERGLAALVDLYLHMARLIGPGKLYASSEKGDAASYFVAEFQKRALDGGPQPGLHAKPVTNFYDGQILPPPLDASGVKGGVSGNLADPPTSEGTGQPPALTSPFTAESPSSAIVAAVLNED